VELSNVFYDKVSIVSGMYLILRVARAPLLKDADHGVNSVAQRSTRFTLLRESDCNRETRNRLPVFDAISAVQNVADERGNSLALASAHL
jgi:hypothetical protein